MAIDRIDWHSGSDNFPPNKPYENGGNHIGYFMEYLYKRDFLPDNSNGEYAIEEYIKVKNGEVSGLKFLIENCDEKFWEADTNEEGLKFTKYIYDYYLENIENILGHSSYEYTYSNEDYKQIEKWMDAQFSIWIANNKPISKEHIKKGSFKNNFWSKLFKRDN